MERLPVKLYNGKSPCQTLQREQVWRPKVHA